ncbi:phosphodiesterase [Pseudomonas brassicacearum]|uniref:HD-GYP domain-containing protein n=1 Tax=Pseudomonas brassicacearum TaxID=930166 RepID=UPI00042ED2FB|nr:HD-GYP domain-containing protein [Pseudomonas brassicacearum]AHL34409.1 phosphodiesterase [Pseudomonas brassicacearum]
MLKRIAVSDLRLGMYITEFCGAWADHPFWRERFLLKNKTDLKRISDSAIHEVWIETDRGLDIAADVPAITAAQADSYAQSVMAVVAEDKTKVVVSVSVEEEAKVARKLCERSKTAVMEMFNQARMGATIELQGADQLITTITNSITRNPHALISLARLKSINEYTYMHSVAVSGLMIGLARQLNLSCTNVHEAGLAGLLHDIGKMAIPQKILDKPGKLTSEEFLTIYQHPELGGQILLNNRHISALVLDVCLHHHEKMDGTGYPHQLAGEQISLFGRMASICDVYDAVTSDRPYKKGWGPADAMHKMAAWEGHFDPVIFQAFVKYMGIFPIGSLVRLESGRLAVVIEQNDSSLLTPNVKVFFSTQNNHSIPRVIVDLSDQKNADRIVSRESYEKWNFKHLNVLWAGQ